MRPNDIFSSQHRQRPTRRAFTLIELMVSIGILVLIMLAIGVTFHSASRTVGLSQGTMEMLSGVRAMQQQLERDISGMDKNCFLIIRPTPNPNNTARNFDQISFIASGWFPNRTGAASAASAFSDTTFSNSAFIWWGQLALELNNPNATQIAANFLPSSQATAVPNGALPSGIYDADYVLGRNTILLLPADAAANNVNPCGFSVPAYSTFALSATPFTPAGDSSVADITKSRVAAARILPGQIATLLPAIQANPANYCYRFASMRDPYESEDTNYPHRLVNGYFRMHPIILQAVASFKIECTDGSTNSSGQLNWTSPAATVCWTGANRSLWPRALRFTYHVADPAGRIPNGRDFVEVVKIPD